MGCDIHIYIERRGADGRWRCCHCLGAPDGDREDWELPLARRPGGRNYYLFGFLTGGEVREDLGPLNCIFPPCGFPSDASNIVRETFERWGCDAHTPSYLTLAQLKTLNGVRELKPAGSSIKTKLRRLITGQGFTPVANIEEYCSGPITWDTLYVVESGMMKDTDWFAFQEELKKPKPDYAKRFKSWCDSAHEPGYTWHEWRIPAKANLGQLFKIMRDMERAEVRVGVPVDMFGHVRSASERHNATGVDRYSWPGQFGIIGDWRRPRDNFYRFLYRDICVATFLDSGGHDDFRMFTDYDDEPLGDYDLTVKPGDDDVRVVFWFDN